MVTRGNARAHEYAGNPEVLKYMPFEPNTSEGSKRFLEQAINKQNNENRTDFELAVVHKKEDKLIGGCARACAGHDN